MTQVVVRGEHLADVTVWWGPAPDPTDLATARDILETIQVSD
jgi:hypothetical protein